MFDLHSLKDICIFISVIVITLMVLISILTAPANAASSLVTVFADGQERSISTQVLTVGEALERANIELGEHDLVEPGLDTFINQAVFRINVYRARPVTVVDNGRQTTIMTPFDSPRLIAEAAGLTVYDEDNYRFEQISDILASNAIGRRLVVERAMPVTIQLYGEQFVHRTQANTVGAALEEAGIVLGADDEVVGGTEASLAANATISVVHKGTEVVTERVAVPFEVQTIYDNNMFTGQTEIRTPGVEGIDIVTFELKLENDQEVARRELQRVTESEPSQEVRVVGTQVADPSSNVAIGQAQAASRGWTGAEWQCLYSLWTKESNWNHLAENPSSGAYGIPQSLPGTKMATVASDWRTNPSTQITWGLNYIQGRYGTPCEAWAHSGVHNWY